ncbi:FUSC family protein [Paraburkholderia sp. CNPSo 3272]|uniref:FUSC family protein n=1 Tax=Paraburkholderia sp. CNPSo 3272 TaxID=2940931 RepID=UPI0020B89362|nr:FUSC family protein [Paraburkholderia sp. CNPSo 3272]MCP3725139.1 FUSC family protein [Paraburkholderia sp. CNPSo 3272]
MNTATDTAGQSETGFARLVRGLADELRAYPGRTNLILRCMLASAIVITVSMALQVPFLALSLVAVFFVTQSNVVMTRLIGIVFMLGTTLAVGSIILVLKLTYDFPLLRILTSTALFFASAYLMRVAKIGAAFLLVGIVVIYVQSFVDLTDQAEALVRISLWVWVATVYAIAVTLVINTLFLPAEPVRQLEDALLGQLAAVDARLAALERGDTSTVTPDASRVENAALTLQKLLRFSTMRDPAFRQRQTFHLARAATVSRLFTAAANLPESTAGLTGSVVPDLRDACARLAESIRTEERFVIASAAVPVSPAAALPGSLFEIGNALRAFADRCAAPEPAESAAEKERMLVPDAFSNPVYAQFALKTSLAALLGYLFYRATDWQGIHTVMLTALIVAQPSLGATGRRSMLRIAGAAAGSLIALAMVIWVVPNIDGLTGLLLMSMPVIALGAWLAAGSERISYAGTQLMFTFALALLEQFGPTTDLREIRDRMLGILLGVAISAVIHASLWPEAEGEALRQRLARLLRRLAARLRQPQEGPPTPLWAELADCEAMAARVALEPGWQFGEAQHEAFQVHMQAVLAQTREILLASVAFEAERRALPELPPEGPRNATRFAETTAASLEAYADDLTARPESVRTPTLAPPSAAKEPTATEATLQATSDAQARVVARAAKLAEQVSTLPHWGVASTAPAFPTEASQA